MNDKGVKMKDMGTKPKTESSVDVAASRLTTGPREPLVKQTPYGRHVTNDLNSPTFTRYHLQE